VTGGITGQALGVSPKLLEHARERHRRTATCIGAGPAAGVTPIIDEQHAFLSVMGERFVLYRMPEVARSEIARRSLDRRGHEPELRQRIRATVGGFPRAVRLRRSAKLRLCGAFC
jgi:hypothetical protein